MKQFCKGCSCWKIHKCKGCERFTGVYPQQIEDVLIGYPPTSRTKAKKAGHYCNDCSSWRIHKCKGCKQFTGSYPPSGQRNNSTNK